MPTCKQLENKKDNESNKGNEVNQLSIKQTTESRVVTKVSFKASFI